MNLLEQKEVTINDTKYLLTALEAVYGLGVMNQLMKLAASGDAPGGDFIKSVVMKSVTVNGVQPSDSWFAKHFSRNYEELYELFGEINKFNFGDDGDEESPNVLADTSEK